MRRTPQPGLGVGPLREDLADSGFTVEGLESLLGPVAAAALGREQPLPAERRSAEVLDLPAAVLLRVFMLGLPVPRRALDRALPRTGVAVAARLGLVDTAGEAADDEVRALVDLRPYAATDASGDVQWWLASDLGEMVTGRGVRRDHVLGVGGASLTLARATVRSPRRRTLDLGTGCGVQALHASRHSASVVATDVSARALAFAAFNAALADVDLDLRRGSLFDPVTEPDDDGSFDLVVSNPPFVITPAGAPRYEYRDGGLTGDAVVGTMVRGMGRVLSPGGVGQLLGNWEHRTGEDWRDRVGAWLEDSGCDGWVVQREVQDPAEYAETWLRDGGVTPERTPAAWREGYARWLDDFRARGVEGVGLGLVVLRRPASGPVRLRRLEEQGGPVHRPLGGHVEAVLDAEDWLAAHDDAAMVTARLVVAADVVEDRHHVPGSAHPSVVALRQAEGFARTVPVPTEVAGFVGACDGELTVGQILGGLAAVLDVPAAQVAAAVLPRARELLRDGLLRVAGPEPGAPAGSS